MHKANINKIVNKSVELCSFNAFSCTLFHIAFRPKDVMELRRRTERRKLSLKHIVKVSEARKIKRKGVNSSNVIWEFSIYIIMHTLSACLFNYHSH